MERYGFLAGLACIFGGIVAAFGATVSGELEPEAITARIREHRMGDLVVKAGPGAEPPPADTAAAPEDSASPAGPEASELEGLSGTTDSRTEDKKPKFHKKYD